MIAGMKDPREVLAFIISVLSIVTALEMCYF